MVRWITGLLFVAQNDTWVGKEEIYIEPYVGTMLVDMLNALQCREGCTFQYRIYVKGLTSTHTMR